MGVIYRSYAYDFHIATIVLEISARSIDIKVIHAIDGVEKCSQVGRGARRIHMGLQDVAWWKCT